MPSSRIPAWSMDASLLATDPSVGGGKGYNLARLSNWGFRVPEFGVLTAEAYRYQVTVGRFPAGTLEAVEAAARSWPGDYVSVRSSMTIEDGDLTSFAGILESYLYVTKDRIAEHVLKCYEALKADRVRAYFEKQKIDPHDPRLAVGVVVQRMVASRCSGVAFSRSPALHSGLLYIEAGLGLGEGIVSGHVEVDRHWVDRFGKEWKREITAKRSQVVFDPGERKVVLRESAASSEPCLSEGQVDELSRQLVLIESRMGKGADVEWAVDENGLLHILQARPITQSHALLEYFSDTNLTESYPGRVSPLTSSFVRRAYTKVIGEGIEILGARRSEHPALDRALKGLIRDFEGHLYYDLRNYYLTLCFLPGGKSNVEGWHKMIGGRHMPDIGIDESVLPTKALELRMYAELARLAWTHEKVFKGFLEESFDLLRTLEGELASKSTALETARFALECLARIPDWGLTILNDFLVIVGLKAFDALGKRYGLSEKEQLGLLRTRRGVDSLKALEEMGTLAKSVDAPSRRALEAYLASETSRADELEGFLDFLRREGAGDLEKRVRTYLSVYGERSFEELKLESMPFSRSPKLFARFLLWNVDNRDGGGKATATEDEAETIVDLSRFGWATRFAIERARRVTERAVEARESTRLMRGRYYGLIRLCALRLAKQLPEEDPLAFAGLEREDFFSLNFEDFEEWTSRGLSHAELAARIQNRKAWRTETFDYPEHLAHSSEDEKPYFVVLERLAASQPAVADGNLRGMGAAKGRVTGRALVISDPREAMAVPDLGERVLVTKSTDPAWIFIMSRCAGLVSEKGSLLSHTAIVGRELGIPTVVGVEGACRALRTDDPIEIDGESGEIRRV